MAKRIPAPVEPKQVTVVEASHNDKIGIASATYVTQDSCPTCDLFGEGCYGEDGNVAFVTRRLNNAAAVNPKTPEELAAIEADGIRDLTGRLDLRVHVVGDCRTDRAAELVGSAMVDHTRKHGMRAWTYTHAWRTVARASWQGASVLASCETTADVREAHDLGWAAALVVESFPNGRKAFEVDGEKVIPCPEQTGAVEVCIDCGLCMDVERLRAIKASIGFATEAHMRTKAANAALQRARDRYLAKLGVQITLPIEEEV